MGKCLRLGWLIICVVVYAVAFQSSAVAEAGCLDLWLRGLNDDAASRRVEFRSNERVVLCFATKQAGFVTIWDSPPSGNPSRIYPNRFTHQGGDDLRAARVDVTNGTCFGGPNSFPLFLPPSQGQGLAKLSILFTPTLDGQVPEQEYTIPGRQARRFALEDRLSRSSNETLQQCSGPSNLYLTYQVKQ